MKNYLGLFTMVLMLCWLIWLKPCHAQQELKTQVEKVKVQLRQGDFSSLEYLKQNSQKVLPLLKDWANDESDYVRYGLIAVSSTYESRQSLLEIAKVLSFNDSNRRFASDTIFLYGAFRSNALLDTDSKRAFLGYLSESFKKQPDAQILIMISAIDTKEALSLIEQVKTKKVEFYLNNQIFFFERNFLLDLSETQSAEQRQFDKEKFDKYYQEVAKVTFSLYCIAWLNKENVKYQVESFKLDKRIAVQQDVGEGEIREQRVCDIALESFAYILGIRNNIGYRTGRMFSEDKLAVVARQIEAKVKDAVSQETPYLEIGK